MPPLALLTNGDGGGVDPAGGEQVPQPDIAVLWHQAICPRCEGSWVKLKQRCKIIGVWDRDQMVHRTCGIQT